MKYTGTCPQDDHDIKPLKYLIGIPNTIQESIQKDKQFILVSEEWPF